MMQIWYVTLIVLLFSAVACNEAANTSGSTNYQEIIEVNTDSESLDTVSVDEVIDSNLQIDLDQLLSKIDTVYTLPFSIDSNFVAAQDENYEASSNLSNLEVQYLSQNIIKNEPTEWSSYAITTFIDIDSMKLTGTYEDYLSTLDIGMMKEVEANVHSQVSINSKSFILLWNVTYSTLEACPYSSGTVIFGTFFTDNNAVNTITLGETSGGADAPYWADTFVTSIISTSSIATRKVDKNGGEEDEETGEEIVDRTDKTFHLKLTKFGFESIEPKQ